MTQVEDLKNEKKNEINAKPYIKWLLFAIAFILTAFCICSSAYQVDLESVEVGDVATKDYVALEDTVDEVATEKLRTAAANSVGPIYKIDSVVEQTTAQQMNDVFEVLRDVSLNLEEEEEFYDVVAETSLALPVLLESYHLSAFEGLSRYNQIVFAEDCVDVLHQIYSAGLSADELEAGKNEAYSAMTQTSWSASLQSMGYAIICAAMEPNLVLDEEAMELAKEEKRDEVDDVQILKNQKILGEGEIITEEMYEKLVGLGLVGSGSLETNLYLMVGSLLLTIMAFGAVLLFFLWHPNGNVLHKNEEKILFVAYVISVLLIWTMKEISYYTLIPWTLFGVLVSLLIGRRISLLLNGFFAVIACLIFQGDLQVFIYTLILGGFGGLLIQKTKKRSQIVPVSIAMAALSIVLIVALTFFVGGGYDSIIWVKGACGALINLVVITVAVGSLPFWEAVFEINTPLRLVELTNPNNELLKRLMIEAPGTYHHCLLVANLAETAVYEIGGNGALARAGAYYHDVGKLKYPMFFAENQAGHNPHDDMSPLESAHIITRHTKNGMELAKEYKLPKAVAAFIEEHHGTSLVKYFYFKAMKEYGAENVNEADYRYMGRIPKGRESAVVMLADVVEAATRAMLGSGKTLAEAEVAMRGLIKDKMDDGQLDDSDLTLSEIQVIQGAFMKVFHGMYHERVSYPKQEELDQAKEDARTKIQEEKAAEEAAKIEEIEVNETEEMKVETNDDTD